MGNSFDISNLQPLNRSNCCINFIAKSDINGDRRRSTIVHVLFCNKVYIIECYTLLESVGESLC